MTSRGLCTSWASTANTHNGKLAVTQPFARRPRLGHFTDRQRFKYRHLAKWWYRWFYFLFTYVAKRGFLDGAAGFHYAFFKLWYFQTIRLLIREAG